MKDLIITLEGQTIHHQIDDSAGICWDTDRRIEYRDGLVYEIVESTISWTQVRTRAPENHWEEYEAGRWK